MLFRRLSISNRLALVLWGAAAFVFIAAGGGLLLYQSLTVEHRAWQIMEPYAQLVSVGAGAAVDFEDTQRAQEILDSLRASPQILEAEIFLDGGRPLASFSRRPDAKPPPLATRPDGIHLGRDSAELLQGLPRNARLRISMSLDQLNAQTHQVLWIFGAGMLVLLAVTAAQLTVLRRAIVRPIASLTEATELVRARADYRHRIPTSGTDEVARLSQSFNDMLKGIQQREDDLRQLTLFQRTILDNAAYGLVSTSPDGIVTSFNPAAERLLGYAADEVIGKQTPLLWHDPEEVAYRARQLSADLGETIAPGFAVFTTRPQRGLAEEAEWTFTRKDGRRIPANVSITALRDERGRITGFVGLTYDLTERKRNEMALHRLNRELRAITDCNQILVRAEKEQSLLDEICRIVCDEAGYRMAWVGYAEHDEAKTLRPVAWAGTEGGYLAQVGPTWADSGRGLSVSGTTVRTGKIQMVGDFASDPRVERWREAALQRGYRSCIFLPLKGESATTFGVLGIYSVEADAFTTEEQRLLEELAGDLAFGIVALRTRIERDAAAEQIRIAATAFEAQEGIVITDANQAILKVNRAFTEITGYRSEEIVGATPHVLRSGRQDDAFYRDMWERIHETGSWQGEIWNRRKDGELYPGWLSITAVKNPQGEVTHYVGTQIDITERKAAERKIEHLAYHDLLTELPNRRLLLDRLGRAMASSSRNRNMGALLFIDLDNFKLLNDTCGHDVGDQLLIEVANRLNACVRDGDTISRLGGDEFVVMLEDLSESPQEAAAQAKVVAEKIIWALSQPYEVLGRTHHSTPSIGATLFVDAENSVDELLKQADIAMYQAKAAGRNTLRFYDPAMQATLAARAEMEAALRLGIQAHQFVLHFQAQVDATRRIVGAEALLRWQVGHHMVSPEAFIPIAEETGLILPIGQWVLEEACAQLAAWSHDPHRCNLRLAINVSARQFRQEDFVERVRLALETTGAPPARLKLELTESMVLKDVQDTTEKMSALKALGVGFPMDDFGTGYSSLSYLTRLPLDQLKIDQSFVRNLPDNSNDAAVVQTIITLASGLGLAVIAEGVETEAQRLFLDQHGCPTFQGYLFSRPVPLAAFEELLAHS